jgi:hypothetical protein
VDLEIEKIVLEIEKIMSEIEKILRLCQINIIQIVCRIPQKISDKFQLESLDNLGVITYTNAWFAQNLSASILCLTCRTALNFDLNFSNFLYLLVITLKKELSTAQVLKLRRFLIKQTIKFYSQSNHNDVLYIHRNISRI